MLKPEKWQTTLDTDGKVYGFRKALKLIILGHLLFSVTEPQLRSKHAGVSDIMWAEALGQLEGLESSNRERLWPQLVKGFNKLTNKLFVKTLICIHYFLIKMLNLCNFKMKSYF